MEKGEEVDSEKEIHSKAISYIADCKAFYAYLWKPKCEPNFGSHMCS